MVNHNGNYIISHFFLYFLFDWFNYDFIDQIELVLKVKIYSREKKSKKLNLAETLPDLCHGLASHHTRVPEQS